MVGKITPIANLDPKFSSSSVYYRLLVVNEYDKSETLLLTKSELNRIRKRVKKNPEDEEVLSFLDSATLWVLRALNFISYL